MSPPLPIISCELLDATGLVISGISTSQGGVSRDPFGLNLSFSVGDAEENVRTNRKLFFEALGIPPDRVAIPRQIHSNVVQYARSPGSYPSCDGLITDIPGIYLCVTVADCLPVLIVDTKRKVVAAIHAGWRGTVSMISQVGVMKMVNELYCKPEDMVAYIGPGAGGCCYNVGADVGKMFAPEFTRVEEDNIFIDLKAAIVAQLISCGIARESVAVSPQCTIDNPALFHSYRRDKKSSGRMMGVIGLKGL
jgi:YfiH family protein